MLKQRTQNLRKLYGHLVDTTKDITKSVDDGTQMYDERAYEIFKRQPKSIGHSMDLGARAVTVLHF